MSIPAPRRFVFTFLACCLAPVLLIGSFNLLVDPIGLLPLRGVAGLNEHKPLLRDRERLFKPFAVARLRPQALVFGTSRSNHALDPLHPGFGGLPAYNFSVSGTNIRETRTMFEHALANGAVKLAVVELDMGMFDPDAAVALDYVDSVARRHPFERLLTVGSTALAWNTLGLSLGTLRGQGDGDEYTELGRQTERVFRWRIDSYGGVRNTFEGYMQRLAPAEIRQAALWRTNHVDAGSFPGMQDLRAMVALARERDIRLVFYVSPIHAIDLSAVQQIYGWELLEAWRHAVLAAARSQPGYDVAVWDFSGYNTVTVEPLPAKRSAAVMQYYWDQSHYTLPVGNWILDRIFGVAGTGAPAPADFGVRLAPDTLDAHAEAIRAGAARWLTSHPEEADFVHGLTPAAHPKP